MKFIIIEGCNFTDFPVGGLLSFAKQLMSVYGNQIGLVGYGEDNDPLDVWFKKEIDDVVYDFFAFDKKKARASKPFIPARISSYLNVRRNKKRILSCETKNLFVQSHEILKIIVEWNVNSICYRFPGVGNPLERTRYPFFRQFSLYFDKWFLPAALKADVLLAAADKIAISGLRERSNGLLKDKKIHFLSTKVNTSIFHNVSKSIARKKLGFSNNKQIFVTTGRLHHGKGWRFLINVFQKYNRLNNNCLLIFVGDGEDRNELELEIKENKLEGKVIISGFVSSHEVASYIQASDLFLLGSIKEGWSTSLIEALACYKPIVTTRVSSASTIVHEGVNGYIIEQNDIDDFILAITKALKLDAFHSYVDDEIDKYSLNKLKDNLGEIWSPAK